MMKIGSNLPAWSNLAAIRCIGDASSRPCLGTGCHRHIETDGIRSLNRKLMKSRNLKEDFDHVKIL
jgi:hypothetical protein